MMPLNTADKNRNVAFTLILIKYKHATQAVHAHMQQATVKTVEHVKSTDLDLRSEVTLVNRTIRLQARPFK